MRAVIMYDILLAMSLIILNASLVYVNLEKENNLGTTISIIGLCMAVILLHKGIVKYV